MYQAVVNLLESSQAAVCGGFVVLLPQLWCVGRARVVLEETLRAALWQGGVAHGKEGAESRHRPTL